MKRPFYSIDQRWVRLPQIAVLSVFRQNLWILSDSSINDLTLMKTRRQMIKSTILTAEQRWTAASLLLLPMKLPHLKPQLQPSCPHLHLPECFVGNERAKCCASIERLSNYLLLLLLLHCCIRFFACQSSFGSTLHFYREKRKS